MRKRSPRLERRRADALARKIYQQKGVKKLRKRPEGRDGLKQVKRRPPLPQYLRLQRHVKFAHPFPKPETESLKHPTS